MLAADVLSEEVRRVRKLAAFYRSRGFQPLPSRRDEKRPLVCYADLWEKLAPADLFERFAETNIQVMTGRYWGLLVIDADGPAACDRLESMGPLPRTWISHSGGKGRHYWFTIPRDHPELLPHAVLWKGPGTHEQIERLCDHKLIMAPPSVHPTTGTRYQWLDNGHSHKTLPMPARVPGWLLRAPAIAPETHSDLVPIRLATRLVVTSADRRERYRARDVLDAICDKMGLVKSWGLRLERERPNAAGWCSCHRVTREDRNASASFSPETGCYWEAGEQVIDLFSLATRLGVYLSREDAVLDLARRYRVRTVA